MCVIAQLLSSDTVGGASDAIELHFVSYPLLLEALFQGM